MSIDSEIHRFLDFWEEHGRRPDELRVSGWVLRTPGCEGDFGCCSKQFDLAGLTDALYELAGRNEKSLVGESEEEEHDPPATITVAGINLTSYPYAEIWAHPASNGDPGCIDIVVKRGEEVLEHHKNKALSPNHPSVPQSERDAIEKERRDAEQDNHED